MVLTISAAGIEVILSTMVWVAKEGFFFPYVTDVQLGC